ncbi:hypothetical protein [Eisenbergiella sp.]
MYGWLNVGSLLLGLAALIIPVIIIVRYKKTGNRNQSVLYTTSMCACALSLFFQICYNDHLVKIKDWSALSDTSEAVVSGALNLLLGTILFNIIALVICYSKKADRK